MTSSPGTKPSPRRMPRFRIAAKAAFFFVTGLLVGYCLARHTDVIPSAVVAARGLPHESEDDVTLELTIARGIGVSTEITMRNNGPRPFTCIVGGVADSRGADLTNAGEDSHFSFDGAGEFIH